MRAILVGLLLACGVEKNEEVPEEAYEVYYCVCNFNDENDCLNKSNLTVGIYTCTQAGTRDAAVRRVCLLGETNLYKIAKPNCYISCNECNCRIEETCNSCDDENCLTLTEQ